MEFNNMVKSNETPKKLAIKELNDVYGASLQKIKLDDDWYAKTNYISGKMSDDLCQDRKYNFLFE